MKSVNFKLIFKKSNIYSQQTLLNLMNKLKILFILKERHDYYCYSSTQEVYKTGMYNSCKFVVDMLNNSGFDAKLVIIKDNNYIDKEVSLFKPSIVIIEGIWVVPDKFNILKKLHPKVTWVIRCHSDIPFLAQEGIAFGWIREYIEKGVKVAPNSKRMYKELIAYSEGFGIDVECIEQHIVLLENYYPIDSEKVSKSFYKQSKTLEVGCFGAIRPLKNQMTQAMAAYIYARKYNKHLRFHINVSRIEMKGEAILRNLRSFFTNLEYTELVEHSWMTHEEFLKVLYDMDLSMQVSFSETFDIIAADSVSVDTPVIASSEVPFIHKYQASPVSTHDILDKMYCILKNKSGLFKEKRRALMKYSEKSKELWIDWLKSF